MKSSLSLMSLFIGITLLTVARSAPAGEVLEKMLANYVGGEWRIDGAWTDGAPIHGREVFEWGVGKQFVICKTFLATPKGEYQRYETIFGEEDGKLMAWSFTYDGHADAMEFKVDGRKMSSAKPMPDATDGQTTLLQSVEMIEPNKFQWKVAAQKPGELKPLMDGTWIRSADTSAEKPTIVWPKNPPSPDDRLLDLMSPLIGIWSINATWSDAKPLRARKTYEWGVGKKFIACKTTVLKPDGSVDYDRYYTLYGVRDGKLMAYRFVFDGTTDFEPQTVDGQRIGGVRVFKHPGAAETRVNQFQELVDPDHLHWKVWNDADGPDKPLMDGTWTRDAVGAAK
jgi:hypothetical protein